MVCDECDVNSLYTVAPSKARGYYDPRKWIRECEVAMVKRVKDAGANVSDSLGSDSTNSIAMENGPFIDGLPIKNGDFPWLC